MVRRHITLFLLLLIVFALKPAAASKPELPQIATLSGAQILSLLQHNGPPYQVNAKDLGLRSNSQIELYIQRCNGSGKWFDKETSRDQSPNSCYWLMDELYSGNSTPQQKLLVRLLGCWWEATATSEAHCANFAALLVQVGNTDGAKVVLSQAPGCQTTDRAGDPMNACIRQAILFSASNFTLHDGSPSSPLSPPLITPTELQTLAINAYNTTKDIDAAMYLQSVGVNVDVAGALAATEQNYRNNAQAKADQTAADNALAAQRQQEANDRLAGFQQMAAAVSANGGLIQQTANQQEGKIMAAANDRPAPQPYTPTQPTVPQPSVPTQPAYQRPVNMQPPAATSSGCVSLIPQVSISSAWKTGLGSMPNEVVVTVTNNASVPVTCSFHYHKAGAWDAAHGEQIDLAPGQTLAGEAAGLWYMGADNSEVNYACFQRNSTTATGGSCAALPF